MEKLTQQQYDSLVKTIATTVLVSNEEFGLGEIGDAIAISKEAVCTWAKENDIEINHLL